MGQVQRGSTEALRESLEAVRHRLCKLHNDPDGSYDFGKLIDKIDSALSVREAGEEEIARDIQRSMSQCGHELPEAVYRYIAIGISRLRPRPALDPATIEACAKVIESIEIPVMWSSQNRRNAESARKNAASRIRSLAGEVKSADQSGWQTIDTAPKDGTRILAHDGEGTRVLYWRKKAWRCPYWGHGPLGDPTHWMPLPRAPESVCWSGN